MPEQAKSTGSLTAIPRVFISYSHDSREHQERVLAFANQLRSDGVDAWIDQYVQDPDEGWIHWMRSQVRQASRVLLVFTETYQRRFEGDEQEGKGFGATFEGAIVTQVLYESGGRNTKFRPVVFSEQEERFIPLELRRFNRYRIDNHDNYQDLIRWLYDAPRIIAPSVGDRPDLPPESVPKLFSSQSRETAAKDRTDTAGNFDSARPESQEVLRWDRHLGHVYRSEGTEIYTQAVQFGATNVSGRPVRIEDARVISAITGETAKVEIYTGAYWVRPSDVGPIPAKTLISLQVKFNPPTGLAAQQLIKSWGTMRLSVTYDGATQEIPIAENMTRDLYANFRPSPIEPRVTVVNAQNVSERLVGLMPEHPSTREPLVDFEAFRRYVPAKLIGRDDQIDALSSAWVQAQEDEPDRPLVVAITGMGGAGKSSLVAKWAASLGDKGWPGCDAVLAWSFYSQGTREVASVSAERFLKYALAFFRDPKMAGSSANAAVKGERLAELIGQHRTLLILDGLEPLQYPPTVPMAGQLRDTGLSALLLGLAKKNRGLCLVTTRIAVHDLNAFLGDTVREHPLGGLPADAGATLLQKLGVEGDIELMKKLVVDVRGHALTLTLLGSFLKRAYGGNIAKRDQVKLEKADATVQGGHAFRAMEAYEQWLLQGGDEGRREVAILRLMGLFDRPADAVSIQKLRSAIVRDFNEPLVGLSDEDLSLSLFTLEEAHLLTVDRQESGEPKSIDAHPLLREYFAGKISGATRKRAEALLANGDGGDAEQGDDNASTSEARPQRDLVFISYSETDRSSRDIIRKVLESDPDIRSRVWDYNDIPGGSDVPKEIARHLAQAKVIVMITSPAYVDPTPGARHFEIDSALEARERNEMDILWIPAKSYKFETPPVGHIMATTGPNPVPLENLRGEKRDNALLSLLSAVRRSLGLPLPTTSEREKREGVGEPHDRLQNALALSGGGFRATFFHLGVLAFHFRRGALGELNIITAVSGGSILAAHAVLHWETLKRDEAGFRTVMAKLVTLARSNVRDRILVRWLWSVGTGWRFLGTAANRLARSRTGRLVRAYRDFYGEQPLHNLQQPDRPWLALVATDLYNSSRIYFSHDGMRRISIADGARQEPFPQKIELDIAFAVAASSCFPPVFRALVLDYNVLKVRWDKFKLRLRLQDGGVHDNLGLRALQYIAPPENVSLGTIHASYATNPPDIREPRTGLLADRLRALSIFTQGELAEIANDIATLAGAKPMIVKLGHYVPEDGPHMLNTATQTALMSFRTDLDAPTWQELYALMAHGYQVAALQCEYLDAQDLREARSLFCAILAESLAEENGSITQQEIPSIEKMVSDLSAKQFHRCGVRPKGRIVIHSVLYFLLLSAVALFAQQHGQRIATWIHDAYYSLTSFLVVHQTFGNPGSGAIDSDMAPVPLPTASPIVFLPAPDAAPGEPPFEDLSSTPSGRGVSSIGYSLDGQFAVVCANSDGATVWRRTSKGLLELRNRLSGWATEVKFNSTGSAFIAGSGVRKLQFPSESTAQLLNPIPEHPVQSIAISFDETKAVWIEPSREPLVQAGPESGLPLPRPETQVDFLGQVGLFDLVGNHESWRITTMTPIVPTIYFLNDNLCAVTSNCLYIFDLTTKLMTPYQPCTHIVTVLQKEESGVLSDSTNEWMKMGIKSIAPASSPVIFDTIEGRAGCHSGAISPGNKALAAVVYFSDRQAILIWDLTTRKRVREWTCPGALAVAWSPLDGQLLVGGVGILRLYRFKEIAH
jgi:predicted acylesterase/phospholipase RssA